MFDAYRLVPEDYGYRLLMGDDSNKSASKCIKPRPKTSAKKKAPAKKTSGQSKKKASAKKTTKAAPKRKRSVPSGGFSRSFSVITSPATFFI